MGLETRRETPVAFETLLKYIVPLMTASLEGITSTCCVISDGAWGTEMQKLGLEPGSSPDYWNLTHAEQVIRVARSYVDAGSEIILTNTFGANKFVLARHGLQELLEEINLRGARLSKEAAGDRALVFGSMGPTGKLLVSGEVTEAEISDSYRRQAESLWQGGVDALLIETMSDVTELKAAARAAREATPLPIVLSMTFDSGKDRTRTMTGITPEQAVEAMVGAGAWMIGANCGAGPEVYVQVCRRMRGLTDRPIWVKPNAGIPRAGAGGIVYPEDPETFADYALQLRSAGANVIGGCCGTSPTYIRRLVAGLRC
jgi:methionine synthase I (cobalamin-dependent)